MTTTSITFAYSDKNERAWSHPTEGWATEADRAFISAEFRAAIEAHPEFHGWTMKPDAKWAACVECDEKITQWWLCEEGEPYCAGCFATTGASCGGCAHDECAQCNDSDSESEEEECETCEKTADALYKGNNGIYEGKWCCDACVAKDDALEDDSESEEEKETCPHCGEEDYLATRGEEWEFAKRVCDGCFNGTKERECEDCGDTFVPREDSTFLVCGGCYDHKQ